MPSPWEKEKEKGGKEAIWYQQVGVISSSQISLAQGEGAKTEGYAQLATGVEVQSIWFWKKLQFLIYMCLQSFMNIIDV